MFHNGRTFKHMFILNTRLSMTYKNEFRNLNLFKTILLLETFYLVVYFIVSQGRGDIPGYSLFRSL